MLKMHQCACVSYQGQSWTGFSEFQVTECKCLSIFKQRRLYDMSSDHFERQKFLPVLKGYTQRWGEKPAIIYSSWLHPTAWSRLKNGLCGLYAMNLELDVKFSSEAFMVLNFACSHKGERVLLHHHTPGQSLCKVGVIVCLGKLQIVKAP